MPERTRLDTQHLGLSIDNRADVQKTLLELYRYLDNRERNPTPREVEYYLDDLIGAAFCLWRAAFLDDQPRVAESVRAAQLAFLETVISTNAITFGDDRRNSAWSVTFYLENAKLRLARAQQYALQHLRTRDNELELRSADPFAAGTGYMPSGIQYEWRSVHASLRIFFKALYPGMNLPIDPPESIQQDPPR